MSRPSCRAAPVTLAPIDPNALKRAAQTLAAQLRSEAENQNAYVATFPDGRMSVELEWISPESIAKAVIEAYLNRHGETASSGGTQG
jgi:hypothetical protein